MGKDLHLFDIIRRPLVTEKAYEMNETLNQYAFEVDLSANKIQIKDAVELIFDVDVIRVNTMVVPPKRGRRGRKLFIRKKKWKKAIITTEQSISLFEA